MRYSFDPVDAHRGDTELSAIAERIGVSRETMQTWRKRGMSEANADRCASALGLHPNQLWPEMCAAHAAEVTRECEHPDCLEDFVLTRSDRRFCSARCRDRARNAKKAAAARERYATDPEWRERKLARRRRYYWNGSRPAELVKQRARDRAKAAA